VTSDDGGRKGSISDANGIPSLDFRLDVFLEFKNQLCRLFSVRGSRILLILNRYNL